MKELDYPYDVKMLRRKKLGMKRELLSQGEFTDIKVAILGGSTTSEIKDMLELFLLNYGLRPTFYESEYGQYWQDAMFENEALESFRPDIVFIHTTNRNIIKWPEVGMSIEDVDCIFNEIMSHFETMWKKLSSRFNCTIIQNNMEMPFFRLLGNKDASSFLGRTNFIMRINMKFCEYADSHDHFYINDINWQSADFGLGDWSDPYYWHMYKYALNLDAVPNLSFNVANIIKSIYGKNKKALALDLDNTLWGGVIGDDGLEGIEIGQETSMGQVYAEFQQYIKDLSRQGIILSIVSKNEYDNAIAGLKHPQSVLNPDDFVSIKANWDPKNKNLVEIAEELSLLPESFVFVDDNPAEREIISQSIPSTCTPILDKPEKYIASIDRGGFFEVTTLSSDDIKRNSMYKENVQRINLEKSFTNYKDYLLSLDMNAEIRPFDALYMKRIAQLTNKSNQFNLTTKRMTEEEVKSISDSDDYITLYGKLVDRFGDNGVVSVMAAKKNDKSIDIILWLMSCRVLKRDMEYAMMDTVVELCVQNGIEEIRGYYYPTAKNGMVKNFYELNGFTKIREDEQGNTVWEMVVRDYVPKNHVITINKGGN